MTGGESRGAMRTLLLLYRRTGKERFLRPLPRAVAYLLRSRLPDGRLARFYELKTHKPLYFTKDYKLTYSDADMPTHYGFKMGCDVEQIATEYEKLKRTDSAELSRPRQSAKPELSGELVRDSEREERPV